MNSEVLEKRVDRVEKVLDDIKHSITLGEISSVKAERIKSAGKSVKHIYNFIVIELFWMFIYGLLYNNPNWFLKYKEYGNLNVPYNMEEYKQYIEKLNNVNTIVSIVVLTVILSQLKKVYHNLTDSTII